MNSIQPDSIEFNSNTKCACFWQTLQQNKFTLFQLFSNCFKFNSTAVTNMQFNLFNFKEFSINSTIWWPNCQFLRPPVHAFSWGFQWGQAVQKRWCWPMAVSLPFLFWELGRGAFSHHPQLFEVVRAGRTRLCYETASWIYATVSWHSFMGPFLLLSPS